MATVIVRPAAIYGPGDPSRFLVIFCHVARGLFPMFGAGKTTYHPLYIDNLDARAYRTSPRGSAAWPAGRYQ